MNVKRRLLILCDPMYQTGFQGFLEAAHEDGALVYIGDKTIKAGFDCKGISFFNRIFKRAAFWMPNPIFVFNLLRGYNILHVHIIGEPTYLSVFIACFLGKFVGHPVSVTCRTAQNIIPKFPFPFSYFLKFNIKNGVKVFPVSQLSEQYAKDIYGIEALGILDNGVPVEFLDEKIDFEEPRSIILFVGSFLERKGFKDFLQLTQIEALTQEYRFVCIGGGIMKNTDFKELGNKYPAVEFIPWVDQKQLISFYKSASVLVVPSKVTDGKDVGGIKRLFPVPWAEQFCRVIIEAYSLGCQVVAYDSGAINEVIYDKAYLVPEGDTRTLSDKVAIATKSSVDERQKLKMYASRYSWKLIYTHFLEKTSHLR